MTTTAAPVEVPRDRLIDTLLREQAQTAEGELARIRAVLADEGTVEKVAEALHLADWRLDPDGDLAHDLAHAALAALAGLIGATDA